MAFIHSINEHFVVLGTSEQQMHNLPRFNARSVMPFIVNGACVSISAMYLLREVNESLEFVQCLYIVSSASASAAAFAVVVWKLKKLFDFCNGIEIIVQESE